MATSRGSRRLTSTAPHAPALCTAHLGIRGGLRPGWPLLAGPLGRRRLLCIYGETGGEGRPSLIHRALGPWGTQLQGTRSTATPAHTRLQTAQRASRSASTALFLKEDQGQGPRKKPKVSRPGANIPAEWAVYLCLGPTGELESEAGPGVQRGQWEPGLARSAGVPPGSRRPRNVPWSQL